MSGAFEADAARFWGGGAVPLGWRGRRGRGWVGPRGSLGLSGRFCGVPGAGGGLFEGGVDAVDVAVVVEGGEEGADFLVLVFGEFGEGFGEVAQFAGLEFPAEGGEGFGDGGEFFGVGEEGGADVAWGDFFGVEVFDVLGAGFDGVVFGGAGAVGVDGFDDAEVFEEEGDAAWGAEGAGFEEGADFGAGAVAVIGEGFDHHGDFVRGEAFVDDGFELGFFGTLAGAGFDGALDGVAGDGIFAGFFEGGVEPGVHGGVDAALLDGDLDFADEFADDLAFFIGGEFPPFLFPLSAHESVKEELRIAEGVCWGGLGTATGTCAGGQGCESSLARGGIRRMGTGAVSLVGRGGIRCDILL